MSHGRKSGEGSRFSACSAGGHREEGGAVVASSNGGGLFSFLKTELDSFVKGLSGKADEDAPPVPAKALRPPTKRQKRSHNDYEQYEREMDAILQHTGRRLSDQDYAPLTEANLRASVSRMEAPPRPARDERRGKSTDPQAVVEAYSSYYAEDAPMAVLSSPPQRSVPVLEVTSPERRRRKRERAATFVHDEEAVIQLRQQLLEEEGRKRTEERQRAQRKKDKEERHTRRRKDRAEALERLQVQEQFETQSAKNNEPIQTSRDVQQVGHEEATKVPQQEQDAAIRRQQQDQEEFLARERQARESLLAARERRRVAELEAEVERLRKELQDAKAAQEQRMAESDTYTRHVHFAPTPPLSDIAPNDTSFLSISSTSSLQLPAIPLPPPPPPIPSKAAKPSPLAALAARKSELSSGSIKGKKLANQVGMPVDMGKFLSEMKDKKLKKVGLPGEGKKDKRDDEESGFKGILETVLKKRFHGERVSGSTVASSSLTSQNLSRKLSTSTSSSITSFSSYRPLDWSMDLDAAPFPPPRTSSLDKPALRKPSRHVPQLSTSSLPAIPSRPTTESTAKSPWTLSHPQAQATPAHSLRRLETPHHVSLLAKMHPRPQAAFGHALTSEEPQRASRVAAKRYAIPHSGLNMHPTPMTASMLAMRDLPQPSTSSTERTKKTSAGSDNTANISFRSAGSSFDIDIYANMQLKTEREGNLDMEEDIGEETRNSLDNPIMTDGNMDFEAPLDFEAPPPQAVQQRLRAMRIPTLRFSNAPLLAEGVFEKQKTSKDSLGRPLSPSKSRNRRKGSRARSNEEDEVLLHEAGITDQDAMLLLAGEESFLAGYGQRY